MTELEFYHSGIKGMKWGIRRYQNKDGTLTDAGKKRYERDIQENKSKKKDNRITIDGPDAKRWVREDTERSKRVVDASKSAVNELSKIEKETSPKSKKKKMDLSNMTDQELRQKISREQLERQYTDLFGEDEAPTVSKGREYTRDIINGVGTALTLTSSALGIALAIRELKG